MNALRLRTIFLVTLGLGALALAACGGSTSAPTLTCGAPTGQVVLAYPAPNSTGIPDNFSGVIFASTNGLSSSYQAYVLPQGQAAYEAFEPVVSVSPPLPTPSATPPFPNPIYQESGTPPGYVLPAATLIDVYLNDGNSNCTPSLLGSFTSA